MKLLLTSGGVSNPTIHQALVDMLGTPIEECDALCVPTASYAHPHAGPGRAWDFVAGRESRNPMTGLGWKSVGLLELTTLPSLGEELWRPWVEAADVLLVGGGDVMYLAHWIRETGLLEVIRDDTVWVGLSAGSMVMAPRVGMDFVQWHAADGDRTLGLVDFHICPHLAPDGMPGNSMAECEEWAAGIEGPAYVMDDQTAIRVVDGAVDVVSEGEWKLITR